MDGANIFCWGKNGKTISALKDFNQVLQKITCKLMYEDQGHKGLGKVRSKPKWKYIALGKNIHFCSKRVFQI